MESRSSSNSIGRPRGPVQGAEEEIRSLPPYREGGEAGGKGRGTTNSTRSDRGLRSPARTTPRGKRSDSTIFSTRRRTRTGRGTSSIGRVKKIKILTSQNNDFLPRRSRPEMSPSNCGQISWSRDESQRIAVWRLLYRLRHPDRELSRLRMISRPGVARDGCGKDPARSGRRDGDIFPGWLGRARPEE